MPLFLPLLTIGLLCRTIPWKNITNVRILFVNLEGLTVLTVCKVGCSQLNILYIILGQLCMLKVVPSPKCIMLVYLWLNRILNISQNVLLQCVFQ